MQTDKQWEKVSSSEKLEGFMSIKINWGGGGLGFKIFKEVSTALLAKIGWFLVSKPDRLWVQNFMAKYGSSNAWLEGERPRILHGFGGELKVANALLKKQRFFLVENEDAWNDPWIQGSKPSPISNEVANHFSIVSQSKWVGKMKQKQATIVFDEYSIRAIKQIPNSKRATLGKLVRLGEKSRNFSVKSAYLTDQVDRFDQENNQV